MIKMAMINIHKRLKAEKDIIKHSKMILQVHDELVFDAHKDEVEILKKLVVEEMEKAMPMNVVIKAEVGVGDNWLEAH
jgi:DNA polymerase-1